MTPALEDDCWLLEAAERRTVCGEGLPGLMACGEGRELLPLEEALTFCWAMWAAGRAPWAAGRAPGGPERRA